MEPKEFKRQLEELRTIITDGIAYFTVWHGLMVEDEISAHALNRYRGMFLPARNALLWAALMQLSKVFDRHRGVISLWNLLEVAKKDRENLTPNATEEKLQEIERQIESNEGLLSRLKSHRDKRLAHHDSKIKGNVKLLYGEVRKLIEEVQSMYNSLSRGHGIGETFFDYLVRQAKRDTSGVVNVMHDDRERAIRKRPKME